MELGFEIDKITESIEDAQTGEVYKTLILPVTQADLKEVSKQKGWLFDWKLEFSQSGHKIYKLVTEKGLYMIHGLISLEKKDGFVLMPLIESAPFNLGKEKKFVGVSCNLIAYACKLSKEYGFDGVVAFDSKTTLVSHYEKTLGAVHIGGRRMIIYEERAEFFINKYFPKRGA
jgi:hypothetical protein